MKTYSYLHRNIAGVHELPYPINPDCPQGTDYLDYMGDKFILLTSAQLAFMAANPTATAKEIIEKQLTPPPPELTLEEQRDMAISRIDQEVENRLNELFPVREIVDNLVRILEDAGDRYISDYIEKRDEIMIASSTAKDAVREANCVSEINTVVDSINELTVEIVARPPEIVIVGKLKG